MAAMGERREERQKVQKGNFLIFNRLKFKKDLFFCFFQVHFLSYIYRPDSKEYKFSNTIFFNLHKKRIGIEIGYVV